MLINLIFGLFVFDVHAVNLVLADVDFPENTGSEVLLEPGRQNEGMVDLAQGREVFTFVDLAFDFGEDYFFNNFRGQILAIRFVLSVFCFLFSVFCLLSSVF